MSQRTRRIDHLLREEISAIIRRDLHDPRVGFVTITGVDVAPDLYHATVWVSILGTPAERRATLQALGRAMPYIRHQLGSLRLKRIPELHLREDDSAERSTRVMRILEGLDTDSPGEGGAAEDTPEDTLEGRSTEGPTDRPDPVPAELPALPSPRRLNEPNPVAPDGTPEAPLPPGYRRRADRVALRKARERRGR